MRNTLLLRLLMSGLILLTALLSLSEADEQIILRYSTQDKNLRIVLESKSQRFVQKAEVKSSYSLVKIQFPGEFVLISPKLPPSEFEFNKKGPNIYLNIKNLKWLKILRLRSPPRLVIDAYLYGERTEEKASQLKPQPKKPAPVIAEERVRKIVIDPGHGGADLGLYTATFTEKQIVLRLALTLRRLLVGKLVFLTRTSDRTVGLMRRILYIRNKSPDIVLSIHMGDSDIFTIYVASEDMMKSLDPLAIAASQMPFVNKSHRLATLLQYTLQQVYRTKTVQVIDDIPLPILTYVNSPVVLIELPNGDFFNYTSKEIAGIADAIKEAIKQYEGQ